MNILTSFTVYTAALHALILILFYVLISGLGYPGLCNGQQGQLEQGCGSPNAIARCASRIAHRANDSVESEQRNKERSSVLRYFLVAYLLLILCLAFFWLL